MTDSGLRVCNECGARLNEQGQGHYSPSRACNDEGEGGICTHCGQLHTAMVSVESPLASWWLNTAQADIEQMMPKVTEYTASDLVLMGQFLAEWTGLDPRAGPEAACAFYLLGKVARAVAAYKEGRVPSEDTLHDMTVYSMMMRRIRAVGGWPS